MIWKTAHTSDNMRYHSTAWWVSCSQMRGLMTANFGDCVCKLGKSKTVSQSHVDHTWHWLMITLLLVPAYCTRTADFMLRQHKSRAFLGKQMNDPRAPWRHARRETMDQSGSQICKRAREQSGANIENLSEETHGHINSAMCNGMAATFTAAHHFI